MAQTLIFSTLSGKAVYSDSALQQNKTEAVSFAAAAANDWLYGMSII
jgi:hypothetical protein